jgi:hypothetical protein
MGRFGEFISKELIKSVDKFELLQCGIQKINDKKKDVDLLFKIELTKTVYYRELKANIELDTEKLPATISKCKEVEESLKISYPEYTINCGVLNWSVYDRKILKAGLSNIKTFLPAEIFSATLVRLASALATQFFTNKLSRGPSTIRTGS